VNIEILCSILESTGVCCRWSYHVHSAIFSVWVPAQSAALDDFIAVQLIGNIHALVDRTEDLDVSY
jgi:hypothetical protein